VLRDNLLIKLWPPPFSDFVQFESKGSGSLSYPIADAFLPQEDLPLTSEVQYPIVTPRGAALAFIPVTSSASRELDSWLKSSTARYFPILLVSSTRSLVIRGEPILRLQPASARSFRIHKSSFGISSDPASSLNIGFFSPADPRAAPCFPTGAITSLRDHR